VDEVYAMLYAADAAQWERPLWVGRARVLAVGPQRLRIETEATAPLEVSVDEITHWAGGEAVELDCGGRMIFFATAAEAHRRHVAWQQEWERSRQAMERELEMILAAA